MRHLSHAGEELELLSDFADILRAFACSGDIVVNHSGIFVLDTNADDVLRRIRSERTLREWVLVDSAY